MSLKIRFVYLYEFVEKKYSMDDVSVGREAGELVGDQSIVIHLLMLEMKRFVFIRPQKTGRLKKALDNKDG